MKKFEIVFGAIKLPLDFLLLFWSFYIARNIRLSTDLIPGVSLPTKTIDNYSLFFFALFGALLYVAIFAFHRLYFIKLTSSKAGEFLNILRYSFYWFIFYSFFIYAGTGVLFSEEIPRLIIGFTLIIGTTFIILERLLLNKIAYSLMQKGIIARKKLLLINNQNFEDISNIIQDIKQANVYEIIGYCNPNIVTNIPYEYFQNTDSIKKLFEERKIDEVLYINSDFSKQEKHRIWELTRIFGIRYRYITNSFEVSKTNTSLSLINTIPVVEINNSGLNAWAKIFKRIFDLAMGIIGAIVLAPIMLLIALLIKLEDPKGPVIYKNKRIGQDGKLFNLYKFRYMKWEYCIKDAYGKEDKNARKIEEELIKTSSKRDGPLYKIKDDPRKTKIGTFIERYSLDETAQFFNLILGNMSLVGPRPHQPREVKKYSLDQKRLLTIKPGITGMAQVNGRDNNDFHKEAELDLFYIENWSVILDLKIILKTFSVLISRK